MGEKVRRRLFHLQKVMESSHHSVLEENHMLKHGRDSSHLAGLMDLESPVQKVINLLRAMQADASLLEWQAAIETTIHKLARAKLHDLFLPSALQLPSSSTSGDRHSETEMVEQILGLGENHRNDADELDADRLTTHDGPHKLDDGVLVEDRRAEILKHVTRSRFGSGASKVRLAKSVSKKIIRKATGGAMGCQETETMASKLSPSSSSNGGGGSLDSPAKAARPVETKIISADVGVSDRAASQSAFSPSRILATSESSAASFRTHSNASPSFHMFDGRLKTLENAMPHWGCGARSIFGLHEHFGPDLLFFILEHAFREFDLFEHFSIDAQKLQHLCSAIVAGYNDHPYHNYIHACDVTHGTYWLLRQRMRSAHERNEQRKSTWGAALLSESRATIHQRHSVQPPHSKPTTDRTPQGDTLGESIPKYAVLAALLSGAIHDINHDGVNNAFHVATSSNLAMMYNDKSVLESMHASTGLQLLRLASNNVLEHMLPDQQRKFRTLCVDMIMGTDLANHFEGLSQMQVKSTEGFKLCGENADLALVLSNVVHAADLGSVSHPPHVYFDWMQRVFREFFTQGERERELGLPVTPFMDRPTASIPKAQQGFVKYICQPLFKAIVEVIPTLRVALDNMNANLDTLVELEAFSTDDIMSAGMVHELLPARAPPEPPEPSSPTSPAPSSPDPERGGMQSMEC